jgi:hypothetical protein
MNRRGFLALLGLAPTAALVPRLGRPERAAKLPPRVEPALYDPGHAHGLVDPGHSHGFVDPGHSHGPWPFDPGHRHTGVAAGWTRGA